MQIDYVYEIHTSCLLSGAASTFLRKMDRGIVHSERHANKDERYKIVRYDIFKHWDRWLKARFWVSCLLPNFLLDLTRQQCDGQGWPDASGPRQEHQMLWEVGYAFPSEVEAKHCTYDMIRCYYAMNVPVNFEIISDSGYTTGHQTLTIHGHGFDSPDVNVKVAGKDWKVT